MELVNQWGLSLSDAFNQGVGVEIIRFFPKLLFAIVIFIAGWVVGTVLGEVVNKIVKSLKVDSLLESAGAREIVTRAGFNLNTGAFFGGLVRWFIILGFFVAALDVFNLTAVNDILSTVIMDFIPSIAVASLILIIGAFLADFVQKTMSGAAKAVQSKSSGLIGGIARWAIWTITILAALQQLGIAGGMIQTLFTGLVAMLALAGGLAFGLGGRDAATNYIEKLRSDISTRN